MTDEIRNKIWNVDLILKDLIHSPQTYGSMLGCLANDGTCQVILRRKLNILCKEGRIFKTNIPGARFGRIIYYVMPKEYYIVIEADRIGSQVYYFKQFIKPSEFYIITQECYKLVSNNWEIINTERSFFEGNILKWI